MTKHSQKTKTMIPSKTKKTYKICEPPSRVASRYGNRGSQKKL